MDKSINIHYKLQFSLAMFVINLGFRLRGRGSNFALGGGFPMPRRVKRELFACGFAGGHRETT